MILLKRIGRIRGLYRGIYVCTKCGQFYVRAIRSGIKNSCCNFCYQNSKNGSNNPCYRHGDYIQKQSRLYSIWHGMKSRASNPNNSNAKRYFLRGVRVCDEWKNYQNFKEWAIGSGYSDELTIDRIDNDGDYSPSNCRWVTSMINSQNSSMAKININTARLIKESLSKGHRKECIANDHGCSISIVKEISANKTWRNA